MAASFFLTTAIIVGGRHKKGYRHSRHTISELGEYDSVHTRIVSLGAFLPVGLVLAFVALLMRIDHPEIAGLSCAIAIGYLVAAAFPCDPGSPLVGTARQSLHNLGGAIEYVGGAYALLRIAESLGPAFRVAGIVVFAAAVLLSFESAYRGFVQRVAETCLFAGLCIALWQV
jgi:hypothetical protein